MSEEESLPIVFSDVVSEASFQREKIAARLPFALRAWWMREHVGFGDFNYYGVGTVTMPLQSKRSDPLCDSGNMDTPI